MGIWLKVGGARGANGLDLVSKRDGSLHLLRGSTHFSSFPSSSAANISKTESGTTKEASCSRMSARLVHSARTSWYTEDLAAVINTRGGMCNSVAEARNERIRQSSGLPQAASNGVCSTIAPFVRDAQPVDHWIGVNELDSGQHHF